jgi:hypothetical protein
MKNIGIPSPEKLWARHEERILEVFSVALEMLRKRSHLPKRENGINLKLYFMIRRSNHQLRRVGRGLEHIPVWEAHSQPVSEHEEDKSRLNKKPDFQWQMVDGFEPDPEKAYKHYTIECKRLGNPSSKTWKLNENYVTNGILRYVMKEFGYGKFTPSGAMIGYIQSMNPPQILAEVNDFTREESIAGIDSPLYGWNEDGVSRLEQRVHRPEVPPTLFYLRHLWVDLRTFYHEK